MLVYQRVFRMQNEVGTPENEIGFACKTCSYQKHRALENEVSPEKQYGYGEQGRNTPLITGCTRYFAQLKKSSMTILYLDKIIIYNMVALFNRLV